MTRETRLTKWVKAVEREREKESGSSAAGRVGERLRDCNVGGRESESGKRRNRESGSVAATSALGNERRAEL